MSTRYGWQPYDDANDDDEHDEHAACISMGGMVGRCRWSQLEEISEIHLGTAGGSIESIAVHSFAVWRWRERERERVSRFYLALIHGHQRFLMSQSLSSMNVSRICNCYLLYITNNIPKLIMKQHETHLQHWLHRALGTWGRKWWLLRGRIPWLPWAKWAASPQLSQRKLRKRNRWRGRRCWPGSCCHWWCCWCWCWCWWCCCCCCCCCCCFVVVVDDDDDGDDDDDDDDDDGRHHVEVMCCPLGRIPAAVAAGSRLCGYSHSISCAHGKADRRDCHMRFFFTLSHIILIGYP